MGSSSKTKTTMAKRNRENAVRERRARKQARKDARKRAAADVASGAIEAPVDDDDASNETPPVDVGRPSTAAP